MADHECPETVRARLRSLVGPAPDLLDWVTGRMRRIEVPADSVLINRGDSAEPLWIVELGRVSLSGLVGDRPAELAVFAEGDLLSVVLQLDDRRSPFTLRALSDSVLWALSGSDIGELAAQWGASSATLVEALSTNGWRIRMALGLRASYLLAGLPSEDIWRLTAGTRIVTIRGGSPVMRKGEPSDAIFVVLAGRIVVDLGSEPGKEANLVEHGPGESIGEVGVVSGQPRSADVFAARESVLARIDREAYLELIRQRPAETVQSLMHVVQGRWRADVRRGRRQGRNLPTLALIPAHAGIDVRESAERLGATLRRRGTVEVLTASVCAASGFAENGRIIDEDHPRRPALLAWLNEMEQRSGCILFAGDANDLAWTRCVIRQADQFFLVADGDGPPALGSVERALLDAGLLDGRRYSLVLLHAAHNLRPRGSAQHRALRKIEALHHVRADDAAGWERIARLVTGHAVGVVLGGGGARGFAHVGVLKALEEASVPVDLVGGTSVGALVASLYAAGQGPEEILEVIMHMVKLGESFALPPLISFLSGRRFAQELDRLFGEGCIEDLWRRFFAVSCNLTRAEVCIHTTGTVAPAVLASNSLPGLLPPVIKDGDLYVDGGLLNTLPLDVMGGLNQNGLLVVVDVHPLVDFRIEHPIEQGGRAWLAFLGRYVPFMRRPDIPSPVEIIVRAMAIGSLAQRSRLLKRETDLMLDPPVGGYRMHEHARGRDIMKVGYDYACSKIAAWWERQPKL